MRFVLITSYTWLFFFFLIFQATSGRNVANRKLAWLQRFCVLDFLMPWCPLWMWHSPLLTELRFLLVSDHFRIREAARRTGKKCTSAACLKHENRTLAIGRCKICVARASTMTILFFSYVMWKLVNLDSSCTDGSSPNLRHTLSS